MIKTLLTLLPLTLFAEIVFPFQTIEKANSAYRVGDYNESVKLFDRLEKDEPSVYYNRANAEYKAGEYDSALLSYAKAKGVDEAMRLHNVGNIYFQKKEWDKAIERYEASLLVREDNDTRFNLELAKKKKEEKKKKEKEDKKKEDEKNKDKNKEDEDKKKKDEEKKKKEEEQKKQDKKDKDNKEQDKKEQDKKKGQEKEDEKKKKSDEQKAKDAKKKEKQDKMTPKEKLTQKELKRLMQKLNDKKMPTMMYQASPQNRGDRDDKNPW